MQEYILAPPGNFKPAENFSQIKQAKNNLHVIAVKFMNFGKRGFFQ